MGVATRDYIPDTEGMSPLEAARLKKNAMIRTGANHQDYVPDSSDPHALAAPKKRTAEEQADRAMAMAIARQKYADDNAYDFAVTRLKEWTAAQAVDAIVEMAPMTAVMYLVAEAKNSHRDDILNLFPPLQDSDFDKFGPKTAETIQPPAESAESYTASAVSCDTCGKEVKNVAGLKAHVRAKHANPAGESTESPEPQAVAGDPETE